MSAGDERSVRLGGGLLLVLGLGLLPLSCRDWPSNLRGLIDVIHMLKQTEAVQNDIRQCRCSAVAITSTCICRD